MKGSAVGGLVFDDVGESLVTSSGSLMMIEAIRVIGLRSELSSALAPWRAVRACHDPGKVLLDVAITVALGGDCLADVAAVRAQRDLFGMVASDPTVSRLFATLSADAVCADRAVAALRLARGRARHRVWSRCRPLGGTPGTRDGGQVIVDIDATLVTAHSDKEGAQPTHKKSYGFAPMCAFVDHGGHGTGETLTLDLRPGKASPFNSADHIAVLHSALQQLPEGERGQVLFRADAGGASKAFLHHVTDAGLQYSIGFPAHGPVQAAIETIPPGTRRAPRAVRALACHQTRRPSPRRQCAGRLSSSPPGITCAACAASPSPVKAPTGPNAQRNRRSPKPSSS